MKKEWWIILGVAALWFMGRKATAAEGFSYGGEYVTGETARIIAEQDAAFSSTNAFETAPFHG